VRHPNFGPAVSESMSKNNTQATYLVWIESNPAQGGPELNKTSDLGADLLLIVCFLVLKNEGASHKADSYCASLY
jgi:hypothetical protein